VEIWVVGCGGLRRAAELRSIPHPLQKAQRVGHPELWHAIEERENTEILRSAWDDGV